MATMTHDAVRSAATTQMASGLVLAFASAATFGLSGTLARGLMDSGWTPGSAALIRVGIASVVLLVPGLRALNGRWHLLRSGAPTILLYGLAAVAGAQLAYFMAVETLPVGVALLIEYTSPAGVVLWMWLRHSQKPSRLTLLGAGIAALGLIALLNVVGGTSMSVVGVMWALTAMVGAAIYFVISGDDSSDLPPVTLAAGGLLVATVTLATLAVLGILPMSATRTDVQFLAFALPWWAVAGLLGIVTSAIAYVTGIFAARRLGSRLASFVALTEVVAAVTFAWLLLGQQPMPIQLAGAVLVLTGVIIIKIGEPRMSLAAPEPETPPLP